MFPCAPTDQVVLKVPTMTTKLEEMLAGLVRDTASNSAANTQWQGKMDGQVTDISGKVSDLNEKVTGLNKAVADLEATVKNTSAELRKYKEDSDKRMSKLEEDLRALAARLEADIAAAASSNASQTSSSTRASSVPRSRADGNLGEPDQKRSRSAGRNPTRGRPSAGHDGGFVSRPNVLHLVNWPFPMGSSDLQREGKKVMGQHIHAGYNVEYKAKNKSQAVSIIFKTEEDALKVFDNIRESRTQLGWVEKEGATFAKLFLKRDRTMEEKAAGKALSKLWSAVCDHAKKFCVTIQAGELVTDRPRKQLLMKSGFRILSLFQISEPDALGHFSIVENLDDFEHAPHWLTREVVTAIVNECDSEMKNM